MHRFTKKTVHLHTDIMKLSKPYKNTALKNISIGTNSCLADMDLLSNVKTAAPFFDDIELIFYECCGQDNFLNADTLKELIFSAEKYQLSYTVHLPSRMGAGPLDDKWQQNSLRLWNKAVLNTQALSPAAYIWHWDAERYGSSPSENQEQWLNRVLETADLFLSNTKINPKLLCVENLGFDYKLIYPHIKARNLSVCLDMGHWWNSTAPEEGNWKILLRDAKVIHLHGVIKAQKKDHTAIRPENMRDLKLFFEELKKCAEADQKKILTFEVFSPQDTQISWQALESLLKAKD